MEVSPKQTNGNKAKPSQRAKNLRRKFRSSSKKLQRQKLQFEEIQCQKQQAEEHAKKMQLEIELLKAQLIQTPLATTQTNDTLEAFCNEQGVRNHTFGARMIALCINLAKRMSFRAVPQALSTIFQALGLTIKIPSHDSIEHWSKRVGLNQIEKLREHHDDMIWIADHSNQIGQEKILVILGIRASELPPPGETLTLDQLTVLAIVPAKNWKRDDVRKVYNKVAQRCGTPKYLICDGAVELREPVDVLEKAGKKVIVLRDFKHVAANRFEKLLGQTEDFNEFTAKMGTTRSQIQQTELAHLNPPSLKTKARFMNVAPIVRWSELVLFALDNPECETVAKIDPDRLEQKLGWVREFRESIVAWNQCCDVLGCMLAWINRQGLCLESGSELEAHLESELSWKRGSLADQLQNSLVSFVCEQASQLEPGERAWLSSEPIESCFGLYKRREHQHSRSGFTGLIVSLPTLLKNWSPAEVREALAETTNDHVKNWKENNIGQTMAGRRAKAYQELRKSRGKLSQAA
jgi:hypothetical protein